MTTMEADSLKEWMLQQHVEQLQALSSFREQWASGHAAIVSEVNHLREQVTKQNGNVRDLFREMAVVKLSLAQHQENCPLFDTVSTLQRHIDRGDQPPAKEGVRMIDYLQAQISDLKKYQDKQEVRQQATVGTVAWIWREFGRPVVAALVAALLALILYHAFLFVNVPKIGK